MKTYRGNPAAARCYVEAGRARADEYYLTEGNGIAQHYTVSPDDGVRELTPLTGDQYEAWVAGIDPEPGVPKGHLRHDDRAVRFVEVVVNGPKSWSLAAALHDDISAAYDAAQDAAAQQILAWLGQHATTRVGPRSQQIQIPVERLEAAVVRHHSSRAGDPHRHLHLQINARVLAEGNWRGLHTVGIRDSLDAINGIGHAAVMTHPDFRTALAHHGYTLGPETGELHQLADYVGPFSARAAQIGRNIDRYEADWRAANPGREPGPRLRQAWDRRAWADARPDKIVPRSGADMTAQWVRELHELGYHQRAASARINATNIASIDRNEAVAQTLTRLSARQSRWNAADIRGEIEHLLARRNIVTDAAIRTELAEDLTARTLAQCVPLLDRPALPDHVRALTSRQVLAVEADLARRFAARGEQPSTHRAPSLAHATDELDVAQRGAAATLAGEARLVVIEGAAGAGKTTTLAATRATLGQAGHRLVVVTPSRKAAQVARTQVGSTASSAAWLVHQHGYRWSNHGGWTRLAPGDTDPTTGSVYRGPDDGAQLRPNDLLLVDEAGTLDQDTAQALLTITDEHEARVALVGDRHQLPAVGRGGVLDLAARYAAPQACLTLDTIHRFTDSDYARLSLTMRAGDDPGTLFDTLLARGHIQLHSSEVERRQVVAAAAADAITSGAPLAVVADTREQVTELNGVIRDHLIARNRIDDQHAVTTGAGQRLGVGDRVATRRNDHALQVANRDTWTIDTISADGTVSVTGEHGTRTLPAAYVREHLELAYATTVHAAQGDTVTTGHLLVGEHTSAAAAYVGMTRGRETNTAHLVAETVDEAREQWIESFARDRADLGPADAAQLAEREAARYAHLRPLEEVLPELRAAWTVQADADDRLMVAEELRKGLAEVVALRRDRETALQQLTGDLAEADQARQQTEATLQRAETGVAGRAAELADTLQRSWEQQRDLARHAAHTVQAGAGRFGQRRGAVRQASEHLTAWSANWRPYLPTMPTNPDDIVSVAAGYENTARIRAAFDQHARTVAEHAHMDYTPARAAAEYAQQQADQARRSYRDTADRYERVIARHGRAGRVDNPEGLLIKADQSLAALREAAEAAREHVARMLADSTLRVQPADRINTERARWQAQRHAEHAARDQLRRAEQLRRTTRADTYRAPAIEHDHGISR